MKSFRYLLYLGVIVIAFSVVWKNQSHEQVISAASISADKATITGDEPSQARDLQETSAAGIVEDEALQDQEPNPKFVNWFHAEAQSIESRRENAQEAEEEIKRQVSQLKRADFNFLAHTASSPIVPATERILASYLLGLASKNASETLVAMASESTSHPGPHPAHSVDEAKDTQERAYKIMAVDAIYNGESELNSKLQQLQSIVNQSKDQTIKKYAAEKIDELRQIY